MTPVWSYEKRGDFTFRTKRVREPFSAGMYYLAQAVKGDFKSDDVLMWDHSEAWFEFGTTPEDATAKLAREVLS
jgi:hypothetical protein